MPLQRANRSSGENPNTSTVFAQTGRDSERAAQTSNSLSSFTTVSANSITIQGQLTVLDSKTFCFYSRKPQLKCDINYVQLIWEIAAIISRVKRPIIRQHHTVRFVWAVLKVNASPIRVCTNFVLAVYVNGAR